MEKKLYKLPDLPYTYNALEPYIDFETMQIHHGKHHAAYVKNLNDAVGKHDNLFSKSVQELLSDLDVVPEDIRTAVRNNGGGHMNHSMFWQIMSPGAKGEPTGELAQEIKKYFGGFKEFQEKFNEAGLKQFGSGWVWLVQDKEKKLSVMSTPNQDNPISQGYWPIMGNDLWEHAYYLKYRNIRADYLKAWWNVVNWGEVNKRFRA